MTEPSNKQPEPESLRTELTELNVRARTYTSQIWQVPFAYLGILGVVVVQAADKAPRLLPVLLVLLVSGALVGVAVIFHVAAMLDGSRRAVENIRKVEKALNLEETVQHRPCRYVGPIFAILAIAVVLCLIGAGYVTANICSGTATK